MEFKGNNFDPKSGVKQGLIIHMPDKIQKALQ